MKNLTPLELAAVEQATTGSCLLTPLQAENCWAAYNLMVSVPADKVDLRTVRFSKLGLAVDDDMLRNDCGTSGCVAGWVATAEHFKKQGLYAANNFVWRSWPHTQMTPLNSLSDELFGNEEIFENGPSGLAGKRLALERLREHMFYSRLIGREQERTMRQNELELTA